MIRETVSQLAAMQPDHLQPVTSSFRSLRSSGDVDHLGDVSDPREGNEVAINCLARREASPAPADDRDTNVRYPPLQAIETDPQLGSPSARPSCRYPSDPGNATTSLDNNIKLYVRIISLLSIVGSPANHSTSSLAQIERGGQQPKGLNLSDPQGSECKILVAAHVPAA